MQLPRPPLCRGGGTIINVGSGGGASAAEGLVAYGSTKEAIRQLSRVAAREWVPSASG